MKKLNFSQMEVLNGGQLEVSSHPGGYIVDAYGRRWWSTDQTDWGCFALGMAAGIASGMNAIVGGLTVLGCMLVYRQPAHIADTPGFSTVTW